MVDQVTGNADGYQVIGGINKAIKENARASADWKHQSKADTAYALYDVVNEQLFQGLLPTVVIGFDDRLKKSGDYYFEGDNISLKHRFDIRTDLTDLELFVAVMHNAIHAQQNTYKEKGTWYHYTYFISSMKDYGIDVDDLGNTISLTPNILEPTLNRIGQSHLLDRILDFEANEAVVSTSPDTGEQITESKVIVKTPSKPKGTSKMKKWSCNCTNIRCATNLQAYCTNCNSDFEEQV